MERRVRRHRSPTDAVIGRISSAEKADANACRRCRRRDRTAAHHGQGVHVAHDGAGAETFQGSLASLRYDGALAYDGQTIDRLAEPAKRVLVTYPVVQHDATTREQLLTHTAELFRWVEAGQLAMRIGGRYPLADAARAHEDRQARPITGKLLPIP